jgi:hypothetical protein
LEGILFLEYMLHKTAIIGTYVAALQNLNGTIKEEQ